MGMNNFERQIEEETNERVEEACTEAELNAARRCLALCISAESTANAAALIRQEFNLATDDIGVVAQ